MLLAVNQISELTGRDRHGIPKRLENLPFTPGDKGAHLYESREAPPLIYAVDNLEAARAAQARSQASLNAVREGDPAVDLPRSGNQRSRSNLPQLRVQKQTSRKVYTSGSRNLLSALNIL